MGKSSSSLKKKRSSRARTRKRSKSRLRKSYKSKKVRHRDDSVSYSSDSDDSRSLVSVSSSSSEDGYKSKRSRSRIRKGGKDKKKRARRQSSSDEGFRPVKRRKGSKKTNDLKVRKKSDKKKKKKKAKREVSDSSESSGPLSCSTCNNEIGSSDESEVERNGSRFVKKGRHRRREKVRIGSKRRSRPRSRSPYSQRGRSRSRSLSPYSQRGRSRSRSWSSYSHSDERSGYRSEEILISEVNPRRLKSVITVVRERSEDRVREEDEHKEEMVYDYDECPSCRSNDSNDGVSKRDSAQHVALETEMYVEGEKRDEPFNFDSGIISEHDKEEGGDQNNRSSLETVVQNAEKETAQKDSSGVDGPRNYDLETSLRLKALENLRTFRKVSQVDAAKGPSNQNDKNECETKTLITTKAEFVHHKYPEEGDPNKADTVNPPDPKENVNTALTSVPRKSRLISLSSRQESANTCSDMKHVSQFQENPPAKFLTDNSIVGTAQSTTPSSGNDMSNGEEANNASTFNDPSSHPTTLSGDNLNKQQAEATDDSQFQQKTMSVMRGGEMVEVSYKVYIPKKAPALSRRSLRR